MLSLSSLICLLGGLLPTPSKGKMQMEWTAIAFYHDDDDDDDDDRARHNGDDDICHRVDGHDGIKWVWWLRQC